MELELELWRVLIEGHLQPAARDLAIAPGLECPVGPAYKHLTLTGSQKEGSILHNNVLTGVILRCQNNPA